MISIKKENLDIAQIADSGQCFRMRQISVADQSTSNKKKSDKDSVIYEIIARDKRVCASQTPDGIFFDCTEEEYESFWKKYFDIDTDTDYAAIRDMVDPGDEYLINAVKAGSGIRILRQDLWEMIVTFLISQQNNIPRIRKCIENICREYGQKVAFLSGNHISLEISESDDVSSTADQPKQKISGSKDICHPEDQLNHKIPDSGEDFFYAFPTPEALCELPEDGLMPCNLGYRSKYVVRAAKGVVEGTLDLDAISQMDYQGAREALLKVFGIGNKVADCICLFGLHHLEAFPVDTHIKQILEREYAIPGRGEFPFERYDRYAGVIQQYMFYYELIHV